MPYLFLLCGNALLLFICYANKILIGLFCGILLMFIDVLLFFNQYSVLVLLLLMVLKRYYRYLFASDPWVMGYMGQGLNGSSVIPRGPLPSLPFSCV